MAETTAMHREGQRRFHQPAKEFVLFVVCGSLLHCFLSSALRERFLTVLILAVFKWLGNRYYFIHLFVENNDENELVGVRYWYFIIRVRVLPLVVSRQVSHRKTNA
jgi:hypothetical protein